MEVVALCPFTVGTVIWQPQAGAWTLTACVKGTFKLDHGRDVALDERQEAVHDDRFFPDNPRGSLYGPSDLVPFKPRGEVTLVGHAYAPRARPVEALVARLSVGDLDKALGVVGNRVWKEGPDGLEPSSPEPFVKMPLRYERAARGPDNPVGLDLAAPPVAGALALPNLEAIEDDERPGRTVGFGPIAPSWSARKNLLAGAPPPAGPETPLPPGFDFAYYNAAPRDQQVDLLRANAKVVLENLHPRHARLETRIPAVRPKAFLVDARGKATEIALRCDTVWIDTDRGTMALTWRGLTGVDTGDADSLGTLVVAVETKGKEIRYKLIENLFREGALASLGTDDLATEERNPMGIRHDSIKPSAPPPPVLPPRSPAERPRVARDRRSEVRSSPPAPGASDAAGSAEPPGSAARVPPAPRVPAIGEAAAERSTARRPEDVAESTQTDVTTDRIPRAYRTGSDPPRPSDAPAPSKAAPETVPRPRDPTDAAAKETPERLPAGVASASQADADPPPRRPPAPSTTEVGAAPRPSASDPGEIGGEGEEAYQTERTQRAKEHQQSSASTADARPAGGASDEPGTKAARAPDAAASRDASSEPKGFGWRDVSGHEAPESPRSEAARAAKSVELDLDSYAEICAELAAEGVERAAVLAARSLDDARFVEVEQRWKSKLDADPSSAARFASALDAARERVRAVGSIRVADFVKVQIAADAGDARRALAEIGLGADDLQLLQRVWRQRAGSDPDVAKALAEAIEAER